MRVAIGERDFEQDRSGVCRGRGEDDNTAKRSGQRARLTQGVRQTTENGWEGMVKGKLEDENERERAWAGYLSSGEGLCRRAWPDRGGAKPDVAGTSRQIT